MTTAELELEPEGAPGPGPDPLPAADRTEAWETEALSGRLLLVLQLASRSYAPAQIAAARGVDVAEVLWHLERATGLLGAATLHRAIASARRRGLIV